MKNNATRLLSLLLVFVLVLGMFPTAMAAENDEAAVETEPSSSEPTADVTGEISDLPDPWQIISDSLPEAIIGDDPNHPYPYGLPVDNYFPEEDPYGIMLMADMEAIPDEMYDNAILRALEYTGFDVQWLKDNGYLYVRQYVSSNLKTNAPDVLSGIGYAESRYLNGDETVTDSSTISGKAPDIASFEQYGLVCASFVSYYINNYLPNIEGVDTSHIHEAIKATTMNNGSYSTASVWSWSTGLNNLANTAGSGVTKYTDAATAYANLVPGDVIIFSDSDGDLTHAAIYAGTYYLYSKSGTNGGEVHFIIHVGNSRGPEISTVEYMGNAGAKSSTPSAWYHLELETVVDATGFIEVYKTDPSDQPLAGAYFVATSEDTADKFIIGPTNDDGYAKSGELPLGTYLVEETVFPDGYTASGETSWTVTITEETPNMTVTINAVNERISGKAKIIKETTNGGTVAGWHFEVKDVGGTVIGTYETDTTGIIMLDLELGTYTVTETDGTQKYWVNDPNPSKTITIKENETATVTFTNQWKGQAQIIKTATNGGTVAGWHFELKDSSGIIVGTYETDATGIITLALEPGTYTVTETDSAYTYWENDPNPTKTVTVKAGATAEVTFTNKWIGQAQIIKTATNGGSVSGWHFEVKNSAGELVGNYVTDATGVITLNLDPDTYTVTETDGEYPYWKNDANPVKTVTVKAGETASITFTNKWNGQAQIIKTATNGGTVAGWHFEVKDAGGTLIGTYETDSTGIITLDLEPGTYTVTETDDAQKYWVNDPNPVRTVTVKAGETAKVSFANEWRGQAQIIKTATNGGTVAGWHFEVKNASGTVIGNYETDSTGIITIDLEPGSYTITETDGKYEYWHNDPQPVRTVTIKAGETVKVSFQNQWVGRAKIIKTTTNGGAVDGWQFTIKNGNGKTVGTYTTDATGIILVDLDPGTYTVQETSKNDPYWYCDTEPQTITVKAGETASVAFQNQWIGKAKIIKTLANPEAGTVEGWTFTIHKVISVDNGVSAEYLTTVTTGEDGTILQNLEPGEYLITEVLEEESLWACVNEKSRTVTIEAGKTTEVTFTNALRPGEIRVQKVDTKGEPLDGVEFLLEWSEDGVTWTPVSYTDAAVPQVGGCTTEGLADGKLYSGKDGLVVFSGLYPTLQYRLTETATRNGYQLLSDYAYEGGLSVDEDLLVTITVVNAEIFALPKTGSNSLVLMPLSILLCLGICAAALFTLRKKKEV